MTWSAIEIAEFAIGHADIRGIRVTIDNPGDFIARDHLLAKALPTYIKAEVGACSKR
jgi:hypothetical protein